MTRQRGLAACWAATGALLCAPLVLPYAADGLLSRTSGLAGLRILRDTGLADSFPVGSIYILLVMPAAGLTLLATAAWPISAAWRALPFLLALAAVITIVSSLGLANPRTWGMALWLALAGFLAGATALAVSALNARTSERTP